MRLRREGSGDSADQAVVASRHQPQALLFLVLQEEVLGDGAAHLLEVGHHFLHREDLRNMKISLLLKLQTGGVYQKHPDVL